MVTQSQSGLAARAAGSQADQAGEEKARQSPSQSTPAGMARRLAIWQVVLGFAVVSLAYWPTAASMVEIWWRSETFNHGFLILPIAAYLAWMRMPKLAPLPSEGSWLGLGVVLAGMVGWWLGDAAGVQLVSHFAFVLILQGVLLASLGWRGYTTMLFPSLYLFLMVPFGEFAVSPLQDLTAEYVVMMARASGVPVFIEGRYIDIPGGSFLVAEACSGVRYLIATFALGLLVQDLLFVTRWRKALIIVLSIAIPIVANVIRAYMILMMAYLSGFKIAVGIDHIIYGWFFFAVVTLFLIAIAYRFREVRTPSPANTPQTQIAQKPAVRSAAPLAAALCLAVLMPISGAASGPDQDPFAELEIPLPQSGPDWQAVPTDNDEWHGHYPAADGTRQAAFADGRGSVDLFVASYAWERPNAELITFENNLTGGRPWDVIGVGRVQAALEDGDQAVASLRLKHGNKQRLIWYYFRVGHDQTADPRVAKLLKVKAKLLHGRSQASVVAVSTELGDDDLAVAQSRLAAFLSEMQLVDALDLALADFAERERNAQRLAEKEN